MSSSLGVGGGIAGKIARTVADASVHTRRQMLDTHRSLGAMVLEDFFDKVSSEIRPTLGDLLAPIADHEDAPAWARRTFNFLARGNGQWQTLLAGTAIGGAMSGGLSDLITNELAPVTRALIAANPHGVLDPATAAQAAARNLAGYNDGPSDAAGAGINSERFRTLVELAYVMPALGEVLDMVNRGLVTEAEGVTMLRRAGVHPTYAQRLVALRRPELSPDRLAQLVTFGVLAQDQAAAVAARTGMSAHDFDLLVQGNGEPPPVEMLAAAFRRGAINADRFRRGLVQGPMRNEWIDLVEVMTRAPMSVADAIEANVKGHLGLDAARKIATENGLMPEHFDTLVATAGIPPGIQEMLSWHNRGLMSSSEVTQGLRESRLNNKYIDLVLRASEALPPMGEIRSLYAHGSIDRPRALDLLQQHGYAADIAGAILAAAAAQKTAKQRDLTVAQIVRLYTDRAIDRDATKRHLVDMGYDDSEAEWIVELADLDRVNKFVNAAINRVHQAYVKRLMDETEVTPLLDRIGVPPAQRQDLLTMWDIERSTVSRGLTEAQVIQALKKGVFDAATALGRLLGLGYSDLDANVLIQMATPSASPAQ